MGEVAVPFEEFWSKTSYEENLRMNKRAWDITNAGGVIMESRYPFGYDKSKVLLVFVDASLDVRVGRSKNRKEYGSLSEEQLRELLIKREEDELQNGRRWFPEMGDYRNPDLCHLVLNTGRMTARGELEAVKAALRPSE